MAQLPPPQGALTSRHSWPPSHALESHSPHVIIHTDSKSSYPRPSETHKHRLHSPPHPHSHSSSGPSDWLHVAAITLNWVPSHVGLSGNEAAAELAKSAVALSQPTTAVLPSLSQTSTQIKSARTPCPASTRGPQSRPIITLCSW
ncbi:hypothetical protein GWK47_017316 [Chionoecetes opilio]|uniref:RNase H type-1 domain-containing protein n=1 Tax=Chionoecetes opilio TaxID=41210 RepID=A0A8J4XW19_CHIOP|nr:hypothetical protein GWK47_017316 [Chionoecetes opilio]